MMRKVESKVPITINFNSTRSSIIVSITTSKVIDVLWTWANDTTDSGNTPPTKNMSTTDGDHVLYADQQSAIIGLFFNTFNLEVTLSDLSTLTNLTHLNLADSKAAGSIATITNMTKLTYLNLCFTPITGDISNLSNLIRLTQLHLYNTPVTGNISNLSNLIDLTQLVLAYTPLIGDIVSLTNLTKLTYLNLYTTSISGNISNLSNMTDLTYLELGNTTVTGDISNLANMTNMVELYLYNTSVSGDIGNLANMTNLTYFHLYNTNVSQVDLSSMISQLWSNRTIFGTNSLNISIGDNNGLTADAIDMIEGTGTYLNDGLKQAGCSVFY